MRDGGEREEKWEREREGREGAKRCRQEGETGKGIRGRDRLGMGSKREDSYPERLGGEGDQACRVTRAPASAPPPKYLDLLACGSTNTRGSVKVSGIKSSLLVVLTVTPSAHHLHPKTHHLQNKSTAPTQ